MGDSPKWVKSKKRRKKKKKEREKERLNDGDNNGQATHGARKHAWRTQAAWANKELMWLKINNKSLKKIYVCETNISFENGFIGHFVFWQTSS